MKQKQIVKDLNVLAGFLARRDVTKLDIDALVEVYGIQEVDLIVVLGNSMPSIALAGAKAYKEGFGRAFMLVGGRGHSTKYLFEHMLKDVDLRNVVSSKDSEASMLRDYVMKKVGLKEEEILLEETSTNCGSNAYEALKVLKKQGMDVKSVLLLQDPTMQRRTHASFLKEWEAQETLFISYAPFVPKLGIVKEKLVLVNEGIPYLWEMDRFLALLMGELPRLRDDRRGYGPNGKGYIVHEEIPSDVKKAYERLSRFFDGGHEVGRLDFLKE